MTSAGKFALVSVVSIALCAGRGLAGQVNPQRVRVSQGVMQGLIVTQVQPKYPEKARKSRIQGPVRLHVIISKEGDVASAESVDGDPLLVPAAIEAVKQWKYKPYLLNGRAIEVDTQVVVSFTLTEKE